MNTNNNIFGERLRALRSARNITQKDFATELGIPQPTLSAYESGKIKPTVDAMMNIADTCGVSLDWLCGRDEIFHMKSLGDVMSCILELYETNEFSIKTTIHDRVDEEGEIDDDENRNWVDLKIYHNEYLHNPEITLNMDLCQSITQAYKLSQELRRYERTQDSYEREKNYFIEKKRNTPITKIDHSNISEEEHRKRMLEFMKEEWEAMEKKSGE
ncbi:MAG: helix-turn-helix domain-containing protein [Lachnospiraceae bacterium]|nr:helix-turn-helix domain-containing protein [Lachnospiraceae bacterium]